MINLRITKEISAIIVIEEMMIEEVEEIRTDLIEEMIIEEAEEIRTGLIEEMEMKEKIQNEHKINGIMIDTKRQ